MFSIANHFKTIFRNVNTITWNYLEAGHGKGAPDGIGGTCKCIADQIVAQGTDISNMKILMNTLESNCPGITFYQVTSNDILKFSNIISSGDITPFRGTLKVHQVKCISSKKLLFNYLSCFSMFYGF